VNVGTENRTKLIAAIALGVVALAVVVSRFTGLFGGGFSSAATPTVSIARPVVPRTPGRNAPRARNAATQQNEASSLDPTLRLNLLRNSEDTKYEGTGRNIFRVFVQPPPRPVVPVVTTSQQPAGPSQPPPPPPINLKFYGFATPAGGTKRIFLAKDEDVFIAKEGDIVDRRYKVVRISPNSVEILDVLSNNRQSIPLTQG